MTSTRPDHDPVATDPDDEMWQKALSALRFYLDSRGTADVPRRVRAHGIRLGQWVLRCREDYWLDVLSAQHTADLEAVDGWSWGRPHRPHSWRHAFCALAHYAAEHDTTVLAAHTTFDGVDLQAWAAAQRRSYATGTISTARIDLLAALPGWQWDAAEARWAQGLAVARLYIGRHGSLVGVGPETRLGQFRLGHWIQRCRADHRAGDLPPERVVELETLPGWSRADPRLQNWSNGLNALRRYVSQTGHAAPASREVIDGFRLGWWVAKRRRDQRQGRLSVDRAAELAAFPGWQWDPVEQRWQRSFTALSDYASSRGHAQPASSQRFDGYPVGYWVRAQRRAHDNGQLSPHRAGKLESLPGWSWVTRKHVE